MPKYPQVRIKLPKGKPFDILEQCRDAATRSGLTREQVARFMYEATLTGREHLILTCRRYFNCK